MCKTKKALLITLIIGSLIIGVVRTTWAGPAEDTAQMAEQWFKYFYEGNAEAIANLYARDASFWGFLNPFRLEGRDAIRTFYAGTFKMFPIRVVVKRYFYNQVYDSTVVRNYYFTMTLGDSKGNVRNYHGRSNIVYMIVDGQRVIVTHHTSLLPSPQ
ncbi:MAG: nuclear transport factor 2 family protein [Deltaproteobacteria bacterium]|nr:nuclear transport factor 2 family protein [Deltaproteobacteria bacterium]